MSRNNFTASKWRSYRTWNFMYRGLQRLFSWISSAIIARNIQNYRILRSEGLVKNRPDTFFTLLQITPLITLFLSVKFSTTEGDINLEDVHFLWTS